MSSVRSVIPSIIFLALCLDTFGGNALAAYPDGTLVRERPGAVVYEIRNGRKFPVVDTRKAAASTVIDIPAAELAQIPDMPLQIQYSDAPPATSPAYGYAPTAPGPPVVTVVPGGYPVTAVPAGVPPRTVNVPQSGFPPQVVPATPSAPVPGLPPPRVP